MRLEPLVAADEQRKRLPHALGDEAEQGTMTSTAAAPSASVAATISNGEAEDEEAVENGRRVYVPSPSPTRNAAPNTTIPVSCGRG